MGNITTYSLPGPFDISSQTSINVTSMMDIGVIDEGATQGFDIEFTPTMMVVHYVYFDKRRLFLGKQWRRFKTKCSKHGIQGNQNYIYQFRLDTNFDVSTAEKVGDLVLDFDDF